MKQFQYSPTRMCSFISNRSFASFASFASFTSSVLLIALTAAVMLFTGINCSLPTPPLGKKNQEKREPIEQPTEGLRKQIERATKGGIAAYCSNDNMCQQDLHCESRIPKGYCTKSCLRSTECPPKSACVRIRFSNGTTFLRCLQTCQKTEDCRPAFYCYHPPKAWKQICLPQASKP